VTDNTGQCKFVFAVGRGTVKLLYGRLRFGRETLGLGPVVECLITRLSIGNMISAGNCEQRHTGVFPKVSLAPFPPLRALFTSSLTVLSARVILMTWVGLCVGVSTVVFADLTRASTVLGTTTGFMFAGIFSSGYAGMK